MIQLKILTKLLPKKITKYEKLNWLRTLFLLCYENSRGVVVAEVKIGGNLNTIN